MDTVGLLGKVLEKAREQGTQGDLHRDVERLAAKYGVTEDEMDAVERYADEVGTGAVVYYP